MTGKLDGKVAFITGSTAGMIRGTTDNPNMGPGGRGYDLTQAGQQATREDAGQQIRVDDGSLLKWPNGPGG